MLRLLRHCADLSLHGLGVVVTSLQLDRDLRRKSAFGGVVFDILYHIGFGLAETSDKFAGFVGGRMAFAGGLDQPAALLRLFTQGHVSPDTFIAGTRLQRKRSLGESRAGIGGEDRYGQRHEQAADDQSCFSGKVQWQPNVFPIEERSRLRLFTIPAGP